jgi:sugar-specific transcriptional regulator TrmB
LDVSTKALASLRDLGFSTYEARAYLALIREKHATGYRISKASGLPRSRVYETLERLTSKGFAVTLPAEPAEYAPVPIEELSTRMRGAFESTMTSLEAEVRKITAGNPPEGIWNLQGRDAILARAREMVKAARKSISLVAWAQTIDSLRPDLEAAERRGVRIIVISCGEVAATPGIHYRHSFEAPVVCRDDSSLNLVADQAEALLGETAPVQECRAAWSRNTGIVRITEEYVRHEVYLHKIIEALGGREEAMLRRAFSDGLREVPHAGRAARRGRVGKGE